VNKRTLIYVAAAVNIAIGGAACSSTRGEEAKNSGRDSGSGDSVTVEGCLTSAPDGRFALTAAPDAAVNTTARAMDNERDTHSYVLIGGDNLPAHLGKRVEVTGTLTGKTRDMEQEATSKSSAPPAAPGGDTPTVKTTEDIDMTVRQLNVQAIRELAPKCVVNP
jgi:hypothetical protein